MKIINTEHFAIQRKIVACKTSESWQNVPHVCYNYEPEVSAFYDTYKKVFSSRCVENKITFNTLMLKVITEGLKQAPVMNSHITYNHRFLRGRIDTFETVNISVPTILPNGEMMTLNLRDFQDRDLEEMTAYIKDINRRAAQSDLVESMYAVSFDNTMQNLRKGKIVETVTRLWGAYVGSSKVKHMRGKEKKAYNAIPESERLTLRDLEPGTITVSNIGSTYLQQHGATSLLEIVPPQVCAISVGAVQDKPVVTTDSRGRKNITVGKVLPMCIAFDHRALDFGEIVPFLKKLDEIFANPEVMLGWLPQTQTKGEEKDDRLHVVA